jgi:nitroreductase
MDLFAAIETRVSALKLCEPAPSREHLLRILQAGGRAPDHGKLAPWRFIVIQGAARNALGELMAQRLLQRNSVITDEELQRERRKVLRAPCIIAATATVTKPHKVPEIEQVLAVGAAVQNMFLAAHALGYGVMWKTGAPAYDASIKAHLGLAVADHIVALLYLGSIDIPGEQRPTVLDERVRWLD